jgi:hypothetical protein
MFQWSTHFEEFYAAAIPDKRDNEALIDSLREFGNLNASLYPKAFAAFIIYEMYNFNNLIETAAHYTYNKSETILHQRLPKDIMLFFKNEFYPAYQEYNNKKRLDYYEHNELINNLIKDSNSSRPWCAAPEYQRFGMSYIYNNDLIIKQDTIFDPIIKEYVEIPEKYKLEFGLLCASGTHANIKIKEVPALVDWKITCIDDGLEKVTW